MLPLFHAPRSRSTRFLWLLEELGAPYEIRKVDIYRAVSNTGARDPSNPHPHGQVPALLDDGVLITESSAIALYLTDKFPAAGLGPVVGDPKRGPYLSWLAYYAGVLEPAVTNLWKQRQDDQDKAQYQAMDDRLRTTLETSPWLLGDTFSAADILFVSLLQFARQMLPPHEVYDEWLARANARPALARALAKDDA
ncbi:glutathione S-transferase family protein [Caulobacter segnis]|uniref:Glutathione S-transferase domain protein n=2 Tax=Caulobacter segnis TaxID=88688 RepID=D5VIY1_CAUST|nr:glutathione S-transferase family protein [Caulobacter segnis]ADG09947.1 Glutathione S-transferase domain protein [Caulobacter segnis ATCC 21756]AVQ01702.1 glutathione S-transferase family protein [Caulobacter segnis]